MLPAAAGILISGWYDRGGRNTKRQPAPIPHHAKRPLQPGPLGLHGRGVASTSSSHPGGGSRRACLAMGARPGSGSWADQVKQATAVCLLLHGHRAALVQGATIQFDPIGLPTTFQQGACQPARSHQWQVRLSMPVRPLSGTTFASATAARCLAAPGDSSR